MAHKGDGRNAYRVLLGRTDRKAHFENLDTDGRIILKGYSRSKMGRHGLD